MATSDRERRKFARRARIFRVVSRLFCRTSHSSDGPVNSGGHPVVVVANHRSFFDVPVGFGLLDKFDLPARILVRAKYFDVPVVGKFLRSAGCISAGTSRKDTIDTAVATLASGRPIGVMLEGRIVPPEKRDESGLGKVRRGFVEIARASDAVILPVAIVGSDEVWPVHRRFPRLRLWHRPLVQVHVGEALTINALTNQEVIETVRSTIASYIARLTLPDAR